MSSPSCPVKDCNCQIFRLLDRHARREERDHVMALVAQLGQLTCPQSKDLRKKVQIEIDQVMNRISGRL